jgi:hypothetical protein
LQGACRGADRQNRSECAGFARPAAVRDRGPGVRVLDLGRETGPPGDEALSVREDSTDDPVRPPQDAWWDAQAYLLGRPDIDDQLVPDDALDG